MVGLAQLKIVLCAHAGYDPVCVEAMVDELVQEGTLVEDDGRYALAEDRG